MSSPVWLSKKLPNGKIICQACSHACKLEENEYSICGVQKVENGKLKLIYGLATVIF